MKPPRIRGGELRLRGARGLDYPFAGPYASSRRWLRQVEGKWAGIEICFCCVIALAEAGEVPSLTAMPPLVRFSPTLAEGMHVPSAPSTPMRAP